MRVFEPRNTKKESKTNKKNWFVFITIIGLVSFFGYVFFVHKTDTSINNENAAHGVFVTETQNVDQEAPLEQKSLRTFSGSEFMAYYNTFAYPNTTEFTTPPIITGNIAADNRIRTIAEARGYRMKSIPQTNLVAYEEHFLQEKAYQPWLDLKAAGAKAGIHFELVSAFRGVDEQRQLFTARLSALGATPDLIATAKADSAIGTILSTTAIPGYSRHHTGYTIDLTCSSQPGVFKKSSCYKWLSANNYQNAKMHGWIPSYPEGAEQQGPEPEEWEYVWLGINALYE